MKIEVLFFEGCPNHQPVFELVKRLVAEQGVAAEITSVNVPDETVADAVGFLGSPTIRIDGIDVEPATRSSRDYGMMCRTYLNTGRREGLPSPELIRAAIQEAVANSSAAGACCAPAKSVPESPQDRSTGSTWLTAGSIVAAVAASLCCILPIVFTLTGITVVGAAAVFAQWRPYLLGVTFGLVGLAFYFAYRPVKAQCAPGSACAVPANRRSSRILLWVATIAVIAFAAIPYYSALVANIVLSSGEARAASGQKTADLRTATFVIEGTDCAGCATIIKKRLNAIAGVRDAAVSYESRKADVRYDPVATSVEQLQSAIAAAGYRARQV